MMARGLCPRGRTAALVLLVCLVLPPVARVAPASSQQVLPMEAPIGFGEAASGGAGGETAWVTSLDDEGPGTLREALARPEPLWIRFAVSGTINLASRLDVTSFKTIDGRGADVTIAGRGLILAEVESVIIVGLRFADGDPSGNADAIQIRDGSHDIWVDHCSLTGWGDGLVDITRGATNVTVSWSRFSDQDKVMLINGENGPNPLRVTLHHNVFERTVQRNPRVRFAQVHAFNNVLRDWGDYGIQVAAEGQLVSQANMYLPSDDLRALRAEDERGAGVRSVDDLVLGSAVVEERRPDEVFDPAAFYEFQVEPASTALAERISVEAGASDVGAASTSTPTPATPTAAPPGSAETSTSPPATSPGGPVIPPTTAATDPEAPVTAPTLPSEPVVPGSEPTTRPPSPDPEIGAPDPTVSETPAPDDGAGPARPGFVALIVVLSAALLGVAMFFWRRTGSGRER